MTRADVADCFAPPGADGAANVNADVVAVGRVNEWVD